MKYDVWNGNRAEKGQHEQIRKLVNMRQILIVNMKHEEDQN